MTTIAEKEVLSLFKYGYFDTVLSARCGVSLKRVIELREMYNLFGKRR